MNDVKQGKPADLPIHSLQLDTEVWAVQAGKVRDVRYNLFSGRVASLAVDGSVHLWDPHLNSISTVSTMSLPALAERRMPRDCAGASHSTLWLRAQVHAGNACAHHMQICWLSSPEAGRRCRAQLWYCSCRSPRLTAVEVNLG